MGKEKIVFVEETITPKSYTRKVARRDVVCAQCGDTFLGTHRSRFCSVACRNKFDYAKHATQRRAARMQRHREQKSEPKKKA